MANSKVLELAVDDRTVTGTSAARRMRREGQVPAVLYGRDSATRNLTLSHRTAHEMLHHPGMMELTISDGDLATAIMKDIQVHPITGDILHIDLITVKADELVQSTVPIYPHGEPAGAAHGGQLQQSLHEIDIECLPADLPEYIEVDISHLELDDSMHVADLVLPEGIKAISDDDLSVFQVRLPRLEEEEEEAEEGVELAEGEEAPEGVEEGEEEESEGADEE